MNLHLLPPGVRFDDYVFTEAQHITQWVHPRCGGVLVVLARNAHWAPKPFEPLYFEEFGNSSPQLDPHVPGMGPRHPAASADIFIAVLPMPFSTASERCSVRDHLIRAYNPAWQKLSSVAAPELQRKLDELERKSGEQTHQLQLLVAMMNKLFEPLPVPPRRPIGFLTQPVPAAPKSDY